MGKYIQAATFDTAGMFLLNFSYPPENCSPLSSTFISAGYLTQNVSEYDADSAKFFHQVTTVIDEYNARYVGTIYSKDWRLLGLSVVDLNRHTGSIVDTFNIYYDYIDAFDDIDVPYTGGIIEIDAYK